jgi:cyd operon protein YbgT
MWYFSWILGTLFAVSFGILNAIWYETKTGNDAEKLGEELQQRTVIKKA